MKKRAGFTLIELLIVVAIIGILAAIALPQFAAYRARAVCAVMASDVKSLLLAQEAYFAENGRYTTNISNPTGPDYLPAWNGWSQINGADSNGYLSDPAQFFRAGDNTELVIRIANTSCHPTTVFTYSTFDGGWVFNGPPSPN
ncbi:MAG: type IV pilin protein [Nitrospinota bacterium]